jgi:hypothetical protein
MTYRKINGTDIWHFCHNCSNWPKVNYQEEKETPRWGGMCKGCRIKDVKGECQKKSGNAGPTGRYEHTAPIGSESHYLGYGEVRPALSRRLSGYG